MLVLWRLAEALREGDDEHVRRRVAMALRGDLGRTGRLAIDPEALERHGGREEAAARL